MQGKGQAFVLLLLLPMGALSWGDIEWENHGNGLQNNRSADMGSWISAGTVWKLRRRWEFRTGFAVSATPAVADGTVYFPGWNGMLYAVDERTGWLRWQFNLLALGSTGSRSTPVVWRELLLVGLLRPPMVVAINRFSAALVWRSPVLDPTPYSIITMSGTVHEGYLYVGLSSGEEVATCCTFKGSFLKMDLRDGRVVWRTYMVPLDLDYYGVAIWGSSPSIDAKRRLVFIATGNNYQVPEDVAICENERAQNNYTTPDTCQDPSNHADSMLALNIDNGNIAWSRKLEAYDVWNLACQLSPTTPNCPPNLGPDYDFGEAPMIIYLDETSRYHRRTRCIVVASQKSGVVWALDCDTGSIDWSTIAGPGGSFGGASWGSCTDGQRVFTNIINNDQQNFVLAPGSAITTGGGWVALDARTGTVLWSVAEPSGGFAIGPVSMSKGVVFGTSYTSSGDVYALDALTGSILWHGTTGAGIYGGVSISRFCTFVGNGYRNLSFVTPYVGTAVSAFCF
ncbi:hypothetical protein L7F22_005984 [Adiantum nelumboides]|nr:hypothetical protein [Adiantum nelumboides]